MCYELFCISNWYLCFHMTNEAPLMWYRFEEDLWEVLGSIPDKDMNLP